MTNKVKDKDLLYYKEEKFAIFRKVASSENWGFISKLFHRFFYCYKHYSLDEDSYYHALHTDLFLEFYMDKRIMYSPTWTYSDFLKWFKDWLSNYDDIKLSEDDNKELAKITHILRFELKR